ncbi:Fic family protein [Ruminococcus sp. YE282]|uniref:Fic family protein n=1 Tax=Ruminococcus sp. YE282 TaxID=3158780 RepID=UPI00088A975E|nr:Fic family protein [Ruminococcus bromii]MEE3497531.1 Fic family protein [Ruminococcus bromii]SCY58196.1 Fic family protein [Ruminococcus bromii]
MYESLLKLFYKDKELYEQEFNSRINSTTAVFIDFYVNNNQAFFIEDSELLKKVINIEKIDKSIHNLVQLLPKLSTNQFKKRCLIDEIVLSNKIEGVHSTRREIDNVLNDIDSNSSKRFKGLVNKYVLLYNMENIEINTPKDIREIYNELALPEIIEDAPNNAPDGKMFRAESVSVMSPTGKSIHTGLYPEKAIIEAMQKAISLLDKDEILDLFKIAIFHYLFGYIHPFYDGNGRTSRFISSYLLSKCLEPIISFRISYTIQENIKQYYEAFKICNDPRNKGDLTPFLFMFIEIIEQSMQQLHEALSIRAKYFEHYSDAIELLPNSDNKKYCRIYYLLVQASLFSENGITIKELIENTDESRSTVLNRLKEISKHDLLVEKKPTKEKHFSLDLNKVDNIILSTE